MEEETIPRLLKPEEASRMLGVFTRDLQDILPYFYRFGPRTIRYLVKDVREAWPRFQPDEDFESALERVLALRRPEEAEKPLAYERGRYKLPVFPVNGRVYFAACGDLIKIGFSKKPRKRLQSLRSGSPFDLKIIAAMPGSLQLERHLHERFKKLRERGEWFHADPKLLRFIKEVAGWKYADKA